jgi:hypothetical protein
VCAASRGPRPEARTAVLYVRVPGYDAPLWFDRLAGVAWRFVAVVLALAVLVAIAVGFESVILPLFLGLLFASALNPINAALRARGVAPALAALAALLVLTVIVGLVVWTTVQAVADEWTSISVELEVGIDRLIASATDAGADEETAEQIAEDLQEGVTDIVQWLVIGVTRFLPVVAGFAATLMLGLLVAFFYLKDGAGMWRWTLQLAAGSGQLVDRIGQRIWKTVSGYILGQAAIAAIDASLIALGALVLGVPHRLRDRPAHVPRRLRAVHWRHHRRRLRRTPGGQRWRRGARRGDAGRGPRRAGVRRQRAAAVDPGSRRQTAPARRRPLGGGWWRAGGLPRHLHRRSGHGVGGRRPR